VRPAEHVQLDPSQKPKAYLPLYVTDEFTDISMAQWLGLILPQIVKDTLQLPDNVIANLPKYKT
jgi:hypothetical protein